MTNETFRTRRALPVSQMLTPLTALLMLIVAPACGDDGVSPGSARIPWRVGGQTCETAGLEWVDVEMYRNQGRLDPTLLTAEDLYDVRRERCAVGKVTFDTVTPGIFSVKVLAYPPYKDSDGIELSRADATFEGQHDELLVRSNQEARPLTSILLSARKGTIYLNWKFSDGMMCNTKGVTRVDVTIFDHFSNKVFEGSYDCDLDDYISALPEEELRTGFRGVKLDSLDVESLSVEVLGYGNETSSPTYRGMQEFELEHGQVRDIIVTLERCYQECN